ncbi:MAG: hypothetical protein E7450_03300 [Ruminococcaceae bacterium]|nr:hypothetical protein [Oscillospiraceae bacterium]
MPMKHKMVDIHTHILPGMDDGADSVDTSIAMLREQARQGVAAVVLTPHFYRERESMEHFLARRERALARLQAGLEVLPQQERETLPQLILGAEVAWRPNMKHMEDLERLCIGQTKNLLLELPNARWTDEVVNSIYNILNQGITPVLAHLERYFQPGRRTKVEEIASIGVPFQISAGALSHPLFGRRLVRLMGREQTAVLASDCHGVASRVPNMASGLEQLQNRLDDETVERILRCGQRIITP